MHIVSLDVFNDDKRPYYKDQDYSVSPTVNYDAEIYPWDEWRKSIDEIVKKIPSGSNIALNGYAPISLWTYFGYKLSERSDVYVNIAKLNKNQRFYRDISSSSYYHIPIKSSIKIVSKLNNNPDGNYDFVFVSGCCYFDDYGHHHVVQLPKLPYEKQHEYIKDAHNIHQFLFDPPRKDGYVRPKDIDLLYEELTHFYSNIVENSNIAISSAGPDIVAFLAGYTMPHVFESIKFLEYDSSIGYYYEAFRI